MMTNPIGQTLLNQFRVDAFIASTRMSVVYRVWDLKRNVPLAMKVLHADLADDPSVLKLFEREANALKKLTHPNIVPFYGLHQTDDFAFLIEAYIDGPTLKDIIRQRKGQPLPFHEALTYLKTLSAALGYAHVHGHDVVHCDVKPGNVMVDRGGNIYLTDFGIARHAESTVTTLGVAGTPAYMAPEQIRGEMVSAATDVYGLGVLLFEMLTGQRPFRGDENGTDSSGPTAAERIRYAHLNLTPTNPRSLNPAISEALALVMLKALAKNPHDRFQTTQELFSACCYALGILPESVEDRAPLHKDYRFDPFPPPQPPPDETGIIASLLISISQTLRGKMGLVFTGGVVLSVILLAWLWATRNQNGPNTSQRTQINRDTQVAEIITVTKTPTVTEQKKPTSTTTSTSIPTLSPTPNPTKTPKQFPTPVGGGGLIAFQSDRTGNFDIYVMNADGSDETQITYDSSHDRAPSWSPDGKEIVYQSNTDGDFEIYVITLSTRRIRQVTFNSCNDYAPERSHRGDKLVFYSDCDGNREIFVMDIDGSNRMQLTYTDEVYNVFPTWSPDGRQITFTSNRSGKYAIYLMNADGTAVYPLAYGCASWFSPNGEQIVFGSYCFDPGDVFIMRSDGSDPLTIYDEYGNKNPNWSRDGKKIVFQSDQKGNFDIWMMDPDGTNLKQLTSDPSSDEIPVWQP